MTTGPGAVPRLGGPVAHQSATARGVACVVGGVLVRELGGRWGAWRLLSSAASPNQVFYNTKVDGEDNGPQRDGALRQPGRSSERVVSVR